MFACGQVPILKLCDRFSDVSFDRLESRIRWAEPVPQGLWGGV